MNTIRELNDDEIMAIAGGELATIPQLPVGDAVNGILSALEALTKNVPVVGPTIHDVAQAINV